jgi:Putative zinc dependent peptidase (DUF5700)
VKLLAAVAIAFASLGQASPVDVRFDTSEADAVLRADWPHVTSTAGYQRLKARELSMGRAFDEEAFRRFVESDNIARRAGELRQTVDAWAHADLSGAVARALQYLPPAARIRATIYLVIKPQGNSFVFETNTNPAIFLYVDPSKTPDQIGNTIAHELHHIALASLGPEYQTSLSKLSPEAQAVGQWLTAFGEGLAMLAAAGGPDVHPHAVSPASDRERWDRDVANFPSDLAKVQQFFLDVLDHKLTGDRVQQTAMTFFGVQGPWYTVGWKMAVVVEQAFGREAVIQGAADPRVLLGNYNRAIRERQLDLPRWSERILSAVGPQ